ncbi:MAG: hypothetical protein DYG89_49185 [Caldilinea sp. CFX5]|nr:hypothetical protein [Caldilinea sp. CFX5]
MRKFALLALIALGLLGMTAPSLWAGSPQPVAQFTTSPLSPLHPGSSDDEDETLEPWQRKGPVASSVVWLPQTQSGAMGVKTHQSGVGWWDAAGKLHIAPQKNGLANIPAEAVMISIPWDAAGVLAPPGWRKMMRPENGEWVIVRL